MSKPHLLHLNKQVTRHGKTVWYVRVGKGPRVRLRACYGSTEFFEEYRAALRFQPKVERKSKAVRGTLQWLWEHYRESQDWKQLSYATKGQRENIMVHVLKSAGAERASAITKRTIQAGIDRRAATPFQAKNFLTTMRELFKWAVDADHVRTNPTDGIRVKKPKSDGFPVWTEDDIVAFEKRWPLGTRERVLFDIYCYTGLRRGDAAALGSKHVTNGVITIKTEKTGMEVSFPVLPALARSLKAGPVGAETFIATLQGKSMTKESVGNFFHDACKTAGIQKSAHGLRKAAATRAADEGATEAELDAVFGWTGGRMAALYTRSANRRRLAKNAMSKLDRAPSPAQGVGENINNNNSLDENWCARED